MTSQPTTTGIDWRQLHFPRPLDADSPIRAVEAWAADDASPQIVLETRADKQGITYWIGGRPSGLRPTLRRLHAALPELQVTTADTERVAATTAAQLKLSTRHRPADVAAAAAIARQLHAVLASVQSGETVVLQLLLGPRRIPLAVPNQSPSSVVVPWYVTAWHGNRGTVDPEKRAALRDKVSRHGFAAVLRIGTTAESADRRRALLRAVFAALRLAESPGLQARLRHTSLDGINRVRPPFFWPLRLNAAEVVALAGWPIGDDDLPGLPPLHPRQLPPLELAKAGDLVVADALAPGVHGQLGYRLSDALRHTLVLGPTGVGKTTLLLNRITQDLGAGRGLVVIEPKDLVADVLRRIPPERRNDVVLLDPTDRQAVVGINPLDAHGRSSELVADSLLATFRAVYGDQLGPRSSDILSNALTVLARHPSASLTMLGPLLVNPGFRRSLTAGAIAADPLGAAPFWSWYESLSDDARSVVTAPLSNKLRPLLRPQLRSVLGQRNPRFNIRQVLTERKVLLVPLQPGVIGPDAAELLAAVIIAELWTALRERAGQSEANRPPVLIYIDEVEHYLRTPVDLADALATSRSLGAGWVLAHQFRGQLSPSMLAAFDGNVRSRIVFQLNASDARAMASGQNRLSPDDFSALPAFHVYAQLLRANSLQPWASGVTLPPPPETSDPAAIRDLSRRGYAQSLSDIEAGFADLVRPSRAATATATGRRRRSA